MISLRKLNRIYNGITRNLNSVTNTDKKTRMDNCDRVINNMKEMNNLTNQLDWDNILSDRNNSSEFNKFIINSKKTSINYLKKYDLAKKYGYEEEGEKLESHLYVNRNLCELLLKIKNNNINLINNNLDKHHFHMKMDDININYELVNQSYYKNMTNHIVVKDLSGYARICTTKNMSYVSFNDLVECSKDKEMTRLNLLKIKKYYPEFVHTSKEDDVYFMMRNIPFMKKNINRLDTFISPNIFPSIEKEIQDQEVLDQITSGDIRRAELGIESSTKNVQASMNIRMLSSDLSKEDKINLKRFRNGDLNNVIEGARYNSFIKDLNGVVD